MTYQDQLAAIEALLPNVIDEGEWMVDAEETQESFADFKAAVTSYNEASATPIRGTVAGASPSSVGVRCRFVKETSAARSPSSTSVIAA